MSEQLYTDRPMPGFYITRLVRGGPFVGVKIWRGFGLDPETGDVIERGWELRALIDGNQADPYETWIWCAGRPIDKATYDHMLAVKDWAVVYAPAEPEANPRQAINSRETAPVGPPRRT